ncbi:Peptidase_M23 domain-containing protein [Candidatus Hydrogenisulfobacillus filiaventi]|uniref:Peptidase_M23 domain-containing protein n=1 Tax=Candidatus Hydrogenisulfobacillus filiaventi TaxID=2707344 RepID=A0A6F8ZEF3_9FIRM|nr:M23 family metallopeptidase [Bacillota bacterium]CAB1128147.1 Peptidase_M23 domain-containing protein [Candidatus Hydrogenisulfobacillus filiaventi]
MRQMGSGRFTSGTMAVAWGSPWQAQIWMAARRTLIAAGAGLALAGLGGGLWWGFHHGSPAAVPTGAPLRQHRAQGPARALPHPTGAGILMPVTGTVAAGFGWQYSTALNQWYYNPGITIAAPAGRPVRAAWAGRVAGVTDTGPLGTQVVVDDGDGVRTVYGHLGRVDVHAGEAVRQGQVLGTVGGASLYSRQQRPHLDFGIYYGSTASNPLAYLHPSS